MVALYVFLSSCDSGLCLNTALNRVEDVLPEELHVLLAAFILKVEVGVEDVVLMVDVEVAGEDVGEDAEEGAGVKAIPNNDTQLRFQQ